jgi:hypothetical protein
LITLTLMRLSTAIDMDLHSMPIAIDVSHDTYERLLGKGQLALPARSRCPSCAGVRCGLTRSTVSRSVVVLVRDAEGEESAEKKDLRIALAMCGDCEARPRVLPSDVLPRKPYGLAVIVSLCGAHAVEDRSLRDAAWKTFTGVTPSHTTLHAWTEGLGAFVLGRQAGRQPDAIAFSAILTETTARWPQVAAVAAATPTINPERYRSQARRERLAAVATVLAVASAVVTASALPVPDGSTPLCTWRQSAIAFGLSSPFSFRTGLRCTRIEHRDFCAVETSGTSPTTGGLACPTRTRSPPGASNRSPLSSTQPSIAPPDGT